jgi:hypothetical protein
MFIIGVDSSSQEEHTGLAFGSIDKGIISIDRVCMGVQDSIVDELAHMILEKSSPILIAIDSPLGWPAVLGAQISRHMAGVPLRGDSKTLFYRHTDLIVKSEIGKLPLSVAADKIALVAKATLDHIHELRKKTKMRIPIATTQGEIDETSIIEVYPAATLKQHGYPYSKYKTPKNIALRREMVKQLGTQINLGSVKNYLIKNDNLVDAVICILAASDFISRTCISPEDYSIKDKTHDYPTMARKEGWIWVKRS